MVDFNKLYRLMEQLMLKNDYDKVTIIYLISDDNEEFKRSYDERIRWKKTISAMLNISDDHPFNAIFFNRVGDIIEARETWKKFYDINPSQCIKVFPNITIFFKC